MASDECSCACHGREVERTVLRNSESEKYICQVLDKEEGTIIEKECCVKG